MPFVLPHTLLNGQPGDLEKIQENFQAIADYFSGSAQGADFEAASIPASRLAAPGQKFPVSLTAARPGSDGGSGFDPISSDAAAMNGWDLDGVYLPAGVTWRIFEINAFSLPKDTIISGNVELYLCFNHAEIVATRLAITDRENRSVSGLPVTISGPGWLTLRAGGLDAAIHDWRELPIHYKAWCYAEHASMP